MFLYFNTGLQQIFWIIINLRIRFKKIWSYYHHHHHHHHHHLYQYFVILVVHDSACLMAILLLSESRKNVLDTKLISRSSGLLERNEETKYSVKWQFSVPRLTKLLVLLYCPTSLKLKPKSAVAHKIQPTQFNSLLWKLHHKRTTPNSILIIKAEILCEVSLPILVNVNIFPQSYIDLSPSQRHCFL
jgi:hypothetical protein